MAQNGDNYLRQGPRQEIEAMSCGTLVTMQRRTTKPIEVVAVAFQHVAPADVREHLRIFGLTVEFLQPDNRIVFRTADLTEGLLSANPALPAMLEVEAQRILAYLDRCGPVSRRGMDLLARRITATPPANEAMALELARSERSLQRELRMRAFGFRQLVEEARREAAVQSMAQPGSAASETAFLLGFSEGYAFTRAFRRWTGAEPAQFHVG